MNDSSALQRAKVSRMTMIITVMLMAMVVAAIVVLPLFTQAGPEGDIYRQESGGSGDEASGNSPGPQPPQPGESVGFLGVQTCPA